MESGQFLKHYRNYLSLKNKLAQTGSASIVIYTGNAIIRRDSNLIGHYHRCLDFLQAKPQIKATEYFPFESTEKRLLLESIFPRDFWSSVKMFLGFTQN